MERVREEAEGEEPGGAAAAVPAAAAAKGPAGGGALDLTAQLGVARCCANACSACEVSQGRRRGRGSLVSTHQPSASYANVLSLFAPASKGPEQCGSQALCLPSTACPFKVFVLSSARAGTRQPDCGRLLKGNAMWWERDAVVHTAPYRLSGELSRGCGGYAARGTRSFRTCSRTHAPVTSDLPVIGAAHSVEPLTWMSRMDLVATGLLPRTPPQAGAGGSLSFSFSFCTLAALA